KKNKPVNGTVNAPINIKPGIEFGFSNTLPRTHNIAKVILKAKKTLEKTQGLPHSWETSSSDGVVILVPAINISSASSFECDLNTSENISFKFKSKLSSLPANLPIDLVVLLNKFFASYFKSMLSAVCFSILSLVLNVSLRSAF